MNYAPSAAGRKRQYVICYIIEILYRCNKVKTFWEHVKHWFNNITDGNFEILEMEVMFGNLSDSLHAREWMQ